MNANRLLSPDQLEHQQQVLESLSSVIRQREAVLLAGSGCSIPMFPSWEQLIRELVQLAQECLPQGYVLPPQLDSELDQLQDIRDAMNAHQGTSRCLDKFHQKLARIFHVDIGTPTRLHELLVALPFRAYLTTNYDRVIERAMGRYDGDRAVDVQTDIPLFVGHAVREMTSSAKPAKVIHLHGTANRPHGMVLTRRDYERAYGLSDGNEDRLQPGARPLFARSILSAVLMTRQVVFIGFGLRDPFLMKVLGDVTADLWEWDSPVHYAIMPINTANAAALLSSAARFRKEYGIEILFYEELNGDHSDLCTILEEIGDNIDIGPIGISPAAHPAVVSSVVHEGQPAMSQQQRLDIDATVVSRIQRNLSRVMDVNV